MAKSLLCFAVKLIFLSSIGSISCLSKVDNKTLMANYKCSRYFYEIEQELASVIPPLDSLKDNYHSIYQALYPANKLPSLYIEVTIQFLLDFQNGTKRINEPETKLLTWSDACMFVTVEVISLDAMSFFSLGTILPQRRQSKLILTVSPVCPNTTLHRDADLWRDVVFMLQDIASNANLSDATLNTVQCVVYGQQGKSQKIQSPYKSTFRKIILWNFCWFVLVGSLFLSFVIWCYLYLLLLSVKDNAEQNTTDNATPNGSGEESHELESLTPNNPEPSPRNAANTHLTPTDGNPNRTSRSVGTPTENADKKQTTKIYLKVIFKVIRYSFFLTLVSLGGNIYFVIMAFKSSDKNWPYQLAYLSIFLGLSLIICPIVSCVCFNDRCNAKKSLYLLFPNVFNSIHHLLWVLCGIVTEPYWATPIVLLEGLVLLSLVYVVYIYQRDIVVKNMDSGKYGYIKWYLFFTLISFWLVLFIVAVVGHGSIVNAPSAGVIEVIATTIFVWAVKNSGIKVI